MHNEDDLHEHPDSNWLGVMQLLHQVGSEDHSRHPRAVMICSLAAEMLMMEQEVQNWVSQCCRQNHRIQNINQVAAPPAVHFSVGNTTFFIYRPPQALLLHAQEGGDVNAKDSADRDAYHIAARPARHTTEHGTEAPSPSLGIMSWLEKLKDFRHSPDFNGHHALHVAIYKRDESAISHLLRPERGWLHIRDYTHPDTRTTEGHDCWDLLAALEAYGLSKPKQFAAQLRAAGFFGRKSNWPVA